MLCLLAAVVTALVQLNIPSSAAGMAAKLVCSATFVAKRNPQDVMREDVRPASIVMQLATVRVDQQRRYVAGNMPGSAERFAVWHQGRGCTLLEPGELPDPRQSRDMLAGPASRVLTKPVVPSYTVATTTLGITRERSQQPWPAGRQAVARQAWPESVDADKLLATVDAAFAAPAASSFNPTTRPWKGQNTRAVLVAHNGELLVDRYGDGFDNNTPQLGWSMTKTVLSALIWKHFVERGTDFNTPVVELMQRVPRVAWVSEWMRDERANIRLSDLLRMRDGLDHQHDGALWNRVPQMLFSMADIAHYAGAAGLVSRPGTDWRYASAVSNLASRVLRDQFTTDEAYWRYPARHLFGPIGARSAVLETDADGTFVGSSYLWATAQDWLRLGQLLANDGRWGNRQVIPAGWLAWATRADTNTAGEAMPYGAHVWLTHGNNRLDCERDVTLPPNGFVLKGHMGQLLAAFPDQQLVVLRMGWTVDDSRWDNCAFLADVVSAFR